MSTPQKIRCHVGNITNHGEHVYTVELLPESSLPRFKAGQFLHLALDPYDPSEYWPESRVFSIASSPSNRNQLLITYSVKGSFTGRMEKELAPGREIWVKMPYGEFLIDASRPSVLIAGGTGMTAFTAFLDDLSEASIVPVTVVYGVRSEKLLIFRSFLEEKQRAVDGLEILYFIEDAKNPTGNEFAGLISVESLLARIPTFRQAEVYLSGPPGMLKKISSDLQASGIAPLQIHTDAWE